MQQKENKIIEYIAIVVTAYLIVWFWPVLFGGPRKNMDYPVPTPMPYSYGSYVKGQVPIANPGSGSAEGPAMDGQEVVPTQPVQVIQINPGSGTVPSPEVCTMDAKICADGSAVGRSGPNCEFAKCPDEK